MANKIITIGRQTKVSGARYADISLRGSSTSGSRFQDESEYMAFLRKKNADDRICDEDRAGPFRIFYNTYGNDQARREAEASRSVKIDRLVDVQAVQNAVQNIFMWLPGERVLNPEFGSNLRKYLYNGITQTNSEQIVAEIRHALATWEPRASVVRVADVSGVQGTENNTVRIEIEYAIPSLTREKTYTYTYTQRTA